MKIYSKIPPHWRAGKIQNSRKAFSLIELMVAMFIFVLVMGAMVAVSVSGFRSYIKSKAIKTITEDVGFALNSIAKDVRMGKIEKTDSDCIGAGLSPNKCLMITRNATQEKVCYRISLDNFSLEVSENVPGDICSSAMDYKKIVDLSGTSMVFDATSGFYSCETDTSAIDASTCFTAAGQGRGWTEINLNVEAPSMETDSIFVQTVVSSRDYGWDDAI